MALILLSVWLWTGHDNKGERCVLYCLILKVVHFYIQTDIHGDKSFCNCGVMSALLFERNVVHV